MKFPALIISAALVSGCASPTVVQKQKISDATLDCAQLEREMNEADEFRSKAEKEKGVTGTNVAAAIFFWPAMLGTYSNANEAIAAANDRKSHLVEMHRAKGCVPGAPARVTSPKELEEQLESLQRMRDKGMLSPHEYEQRRKKLLDSTT
jgi:hypothetical protein